MESLLFSLNAVLPLFLLVVIGYVLKSIGLFSDEWLKAANKFSFTVTFSVMLFNDVYTADTSAININPSLVAFAVIGVLAVTVICYLTVPFIVKDRFRTGVVIQGIFRTNFLLFGMPLVINMFGKQASPIAAVLVSIVIPLYNILAVITLSVFNKFSTNKIDIIKILKGLAKNPLIIGCVVGYAFRFLNIPLPSFMLKTVGQIADIAIPLALIILGGQFKFKGFVKNIKPVSITVAIKLIIVPLIMLTIAILMGFRGVELGVLLAIFTSPCAVSSSIMAYNMDCDGDLAGQIVVFGTLISVITIFLFIFILRLNSFL